MTDLLVGIALVFVVEGLLYALFPQAALNLAERMRSLPQEQLRIAGLMSAILGLGLVWLIRG
ncbi:MAG TPA: DUF2065 domain-containing protein [Alphaproteobacteria bacterium]|nr:hypothetical protein [Paracoccaceae bacterium]RCL80135.1 MAG: DUF2065 domain-containing protein [SAR116 cluster bacterium]HBQ23149.1 DUF2065 domain-containing protein [Alphaproteobacteria bacterium]HCJ61918.1 DUF2065 domain-containing protein [Alphaproteobacteria bacterium]HCY48290.1 DUF2065 domain-containing protein [Alphaproteobacteria bacterium]